MSEKAPKGPKAKFNQETKEWEELRSPSSSETDSPRTDESIPLDDETIADQQHSETLYTDAEILGKRYPIRHMIHEVGNQRMKTVESVSASWKNMLDTPGKFRLGLKRSLAESRYNRQKARFDAVRDLDDTNLMRRHREAKWQKAGEKLAAATNAYTGKKGEMSARREAVGTNAEKRRDTYIAELKGRRESALARRTMRHELRAQGAGRLEARAALKNIAPEHLTRVGSIAGIAYRSERQAHASDKLVAKADKRTKKTGDRIEKNRRKAESYAEEARTASHTIEEITTTHIPEAQRNLTSLQEELDSLDDDDPDRHLLQSQMQEIEDSITAYTERDLPYWQRVAEESRRKVAQLDTTHTSLQDELRRAQRTSETHAEQQNKAHAHAESDQQARTAAVNDVTFQ